MRKLFVLFLLFLSSYNQLSAQLFPREGYKLCYRLIGFQFPVPAGTVKNKIEIAKGTHTTESTFEQNIAKSITITDHKIITEVPSFGTPYTWRVVSYNAANAVAKSEFHHFSVKMTADVDPAMTRLRVIKNAETYKDAYVFIDGNRVLYDMKGNPVWFLPGTEQTDNKSVASRDMKLTPRGTITFFTGSHPYEINYNGSILWQYTNREPAVMHHEFTHLANGHYMGLVYEDRTGQSQPVIQDSIRQYIYDSAGFFRSRRYSNIMEFDEHSRPVWQWNGLQYENGSDLRLRRTVDCNPLDYDLHENSFFFDEKNKIIYMSVRNLSRIIKIKYPEGKVLATYGTVYKPGTTHMENSLFCGQHSCKLSKNGYLYLFNNNSCTTSLPTIVKLQEPGPGKTELKKIWEYQCTVEPQDAAAIGNTRFVSGGSVTELPDQTMLVMMGLPYPKVFIVNNDKKVLWSAVPERYDPIAKKWTYTDQYRACLITSRKDLEQLIWNSEK